MSGYTAQFVVSNNGIESENKANKMCSSILRQTQQVVVMSHPATTCHDWETVQCTHAIKVQGIAEKILLN